MKWQCEIWIESADMIRTGEAFREWEKRLISAFAEFDPAPTHLDCTGYQEDRGFGSVFFHVDAETQFQALEKRKQITDRIDANALNRIVRIRHLCNPTTHF